MFHLMAMLHGNPSDTNSGCIVFLPDALISDICSLSKRTESGLPISHPWGCSIKWKAECKTEKPEEKLSMSCGMQSNNVILICGFVQEDSAIGSTLSSDKSLILNTLTGHLVVGQGVQVTCLVPGCLNCRTGQLLDNRGQMCSPFAPSGKLNESGTQAIWISFSWSLLPALRRFYFMEMLDSLLMSTSTEADGSTVAKYSSITYDELNQLEINCLNKTFGYALSSVILGFTRTLIPERWPTNPNTTENNGSVAISRDNCFIRCRHIVQSSLNLLLKTSCTFTLIKHCQSSPMASLGVGYRDSQSCSPGNLWNLWFRYSYNRPVRRNQPVRQLKLPMITAEPCGWPCIGLTFSLFSAVHLVILLLGLVTPLWSPSSTNLSSPGNSVVDGYLGNQSRSLGYPYQQVPSNCDLSPQLPSLFWFITSTNCSQVPTLGWFYTGIGEDSCESSRLSALNETWTNGNYSMTANSSANSSSTTCPIRPPVHILPVFELVQNLSSLHSNCWYKVAENWIKFFTCELTRLLLWLESGQPAGLKINLLLARLLGDFFIYHLVVWRTYAAFLMSLVGLSVGLLQQLTNVSPLHGSHLFSASLNTLLAILLSTIYAVTACHTTTGSTTVTTPPPPFSIVLITYVSSVVRLTVALLLSLAVDLSTLVAVHLHTFYLYTLRLAQLEFRVIIAAWRLCRNRSKWNPLRCRVDTVLDMCNPPAASGGYRSDAVSTSTSDGTRVGRGRRETVFKALSHAPVNEDVHLDRLLVSTLLGLAVGICLLPTTLAFYLTFAMVRLSVFCFQQLLLTCIDFVLNLPVSALLAWIFSLEDSRSELIVEPSMDASPRVPFIKLQLTRPSFMQAYRRNCLIKCVNLFSRRISVVEAVKRLLTVTEF